MVGSENQKFCQQHSGLQGTRITSQCIIPPFCAYLQDSNMPGGELPYKKDGGACLLYPLGLKTVVLVPVLLGCSASAGAFAVPLLN